MSTNTVWKTLQDNTDKTLLQSQGTKGATRALSAKAPCILLCCRAVLRKTGNDTKWHAAW